MNINEYSNISDQIAFFNNVPTTLYKYRDWSNCFHKRTIEQNKLWFSSPKGLNDPYDCQLPLIVDVEEIKSAKFFEFLLKGAVNKNAAELKWMEILEDPQEYFLQREQEIMHMYFDFGVVSLCESPNEYLLWSHYANGHKGFCIGFDTKQLVKEDAHATFEDVKYQSRLPFFKFLEDSSKVLRKALACKHSRWKYEKEWRLTKISFADKEVTLSKSTIKEIYFGASMDLKSKEEIIKIQNAENTSVKFYDMVLSRNEFEIEPREISII